MSGTPGKIVADGYDAIAEHYAQWTSSSLVRLQWLDLLKQRLPQSARILDLGCGAAMPIASQLCDLGHQYTGVDGSQRQIALARVNAPRGRFIVADMTTVEFEAASFDAVTAFYSITHIPRDRHPELLKRVHGWLKPNGILLASLGHDDTPSWTGEWLGTIMHFSHFDAATNRGLVEQAGFAIETDATIGETEDGRLVKFLWVIARKASR